MMSGQAHLLVNGIPDLLPAIKSGRVQAIAIMADKRHPFLPDVSTMADQGYKDFALPSTVSPSITIPLLALATTRRPASPSGSGDQSPGAPGTCWTGVATGFPQTNETGVRQGNLSALNTEGACGFDDVVGCALHSRIQPWSPITHGTTTRTRRRTVCTDPSDAQAFGGIGTALCACVLRLVCETRV
jgi:Tripartite tricarboxylate transporter family receptor